MRIREKTSTILSAVVFSITLFSPLTGSQKIAIIGGGISGTFSAKYLADYDKNCTLESITIFDPLPIGELTSVTETPNDAWQGSRVATIALSNVGNDENDTLFVEIGASTVASDFHLLVDMFEGDPSLTIQDAEPLARGASSLLGLLHKSISADSLLEIGGGASFWQMFKSHYRYNTDLWTLSSALQNLQRSLRLIHLWLDHADPSTFFESPNDMWEAAKLQKLTHLSFDEFLDALGISKEPSWWKSYLPYQGSIREELLTTWNRANHNQDHSRLNGLAGLVSVLSAFNSGLSVAKGNHNLVKSALEQARRNRQSVCQDNNRIHVVHKQVKTLVGDLDGIEAFDTESKSLGLFDVVVLAAPLQLCRISFMIRSDKDNTVLHEMPLGGRINPNNDNTALHEGYDVLPAPLPSWAKRPYTQAVITVVSQAELQRDRFSTSIDSLPETILFVRDKEKSQNNVTAIKRLSADGIFLASSIDPLSNEELRELFGVSVVVEYVKVWGGPYGGVTPDYQGEGNTLPYLIYDSAAGLDEGTLGGALYYPNSIETSASGMGINAIGAKSVAKLVARRLRLIAPHGDWGTRTGDEL